jgi:hypothetical protein
MEDRLLARAMMRPFFGWGAFGRNTAVNRQAGEGPLVMDGDWVIILGTQGIIGYLILFGGPLLAIFGAGRALRGRSEDEQLWISALCLALATLLLDEIPNSQGGMPLHFMAGILAGVTAGAHQLRRATA